ncbi:MAG: hypothetical protein P8Y97_24110, partial [Candidatus Lokiarchaeota archaeon]
MKEIVKNPKSEDRESKDILECINLLHFMDFNIIELLILELLIKHKDPVIRHTLYYEVSEYLKTFECKVENIPSSQLTEFEMKIVKFIRQKEEKSKLLSPSSFYNNYNDNGKVETIETTDYSQILFEKLAQHLVQFMSISNDFKYIDNLIDELQKIVGVEYVDSLLIIWLPFLFDMRIIKSLKKTAKRLFLLSRIDKEDELKDRGLTDIIITLIYNQTIREPNDVFDIVVFPYYVNVELRGLSIIDLLKEGYRVLKEEGTLIALIDRRAPKTDHITLNRIGKIYNEA